MDEGPHPNDFKQEFLHEDYFYNHAEPHRRRPTLVTFPRFITHTATFFSEDHSRVAFRDWLRGFEDNAWRRRPDTDSLGDPASLKEMLKESVPIPRNDAVLERFSWIAQRSPKEKQKEKEGEPPTEQRQSKDVEFVIELVHQDQDHDYAGIVARVEAHLEFFTLTLFKPLPDKIKIEKVYEDHGPLLVPEDQVKDTNPFHALYARLVKLFPQSTFANFEGVVVSPRAFGSSAPSFPPPGTPLNFGLAASTAIFLRNQRERFSTKNKTGLFAANDEDVVACYFQRGQAIYLSALGAQKNTESKDRLRYLLIYNRARLTKRRRYDPVVDRYRLSRLVHRINAIGTLRLSALRDLRRLRRADDELWQIETDIEFAAHDEAPRSRVRRLGSMIDRLERMARDYADKGTPLFYRTARARLYFDQMKKLLEDLGADPIPEWQSYDQFLRRRLFAQHEFTANLGNRISELWMVARSRAEVAEAQTLRWLQLAAQMASLILLPAAFADMLRQRTDGHSIVGFCYDAVTGWLARVGVEVRPSAIYAWNNWVRSDVRSWWQRPDVQEFWLVFALTFCLWGGLIFFIEWRRRMLPLKSRELERTHKAGVGKRKDVSP